MFRFFLLPDFYSGEIKRWKSQTNKGQQYDHTVTTRCLIWLQGHALCSKWWFQCGYLTCQWNVNVAYFLGF